VDIFVNKTREHGDIPGNYSHTGPLLKFAANLNYFKINGLHLFFRAQKIAAEKIFCYVAQAFYVNKSVDLYCSTTIFGIGMSFHASSIISRMPCTRPQST
jgi:hypothetical protein